MSQGSSIQFMIANVTTTLSTPNWSLIIPCFIFYFLFGYLFYAALFAAVGSVVNEDPQEAQSLMMPIMLPIILAIFIMMNAVQNPIWSSVVATGFINDFTHCRVPLYHMAECKNLQNRNSIIRQKSNHERNGQMGFQKIINGNNRKQKCLSNC